MKSKLPYTRNFSDSEKEFRQPVRRKLETEVPAPVEQDGPTFTP